MRLHPCFEQCLKSNLSQLHAGDYGWCKEATIAALKAGYRHLDCAWKYGVDHEVGAAIRESGVPRSEIFITTKFWPNFSRPEHVEVCLDKCLEGMGLDYVDLFLAHFPVAFKPTSEEGVKKAWAGATASDEDQAIATNENGDPIVDLEYSAFDFAEAKGKCRVSLGHTKSKRSLMCFAGVKGSFVPTWKAMQKLVSAGKTRAVGVSNFSIRQVNELLPHSADIAVSCNQIEAHPWLPNNDVIAFNKKHGIVTTCFSPFAGQKADGNTLLKDQSVIELAKKNDMGIGQLLQSWAVQRGTIPLGKSQSPGMCIHFCFYFAYND